MDDMHDKADSKDLEVSAHIAFDWHANEMLGTAFQAVTQELHHILTDALEQARRNVAPGRGPSDHTGKGTDGHHKEVHGFDWKDTGKLQQAIQIRESWTMTKNQKRVGAPNAGLIVQPIEVTDALSGKTRVINYGAFLELGYYPLIRRKNPDGSITSERGHFTRYPFLGPAMYMATQHLLDRTGMYLTRELANMANRQRKKKALLEREKITPTLVQRLARERWMPPVQEVVDLDERDQQLRHILGPTLVALTMKDRGDRS